MLVIVGSAAIGICLTTLTCILIASRSPRPLSLLVISKPAHASASILLPVLIFTAIVSTFMLSCLIGMFLLHRFYLHLKAASTSSEGDFKLSIDSILSASVDFGIETAGRVGIEIHPTSFVKTDYSLSALAKTVRWEDGEWTDASADTLNEKQGTPVAAPAPATAQAVIDPPPSLSGQTATTTSDPETDIETPTIRRLAMQRLAQDVGARRALGALTDAEVDAFFETRRVRQ